MKKKAAGSQTKIFLLGALAIVLIVTAGFMALGRGDAGSKAGNVAADGIPGAGPLPTWLTKADPQIIADYAWAAQHQAELQYIPCYCGCGSVGHDSNATCYYRWDKAGKILGYDAHAMG